MTSSSAELRAPLTRIDALKQQLDALRPTLTPEVQARVFQKFRLDWNYHSNSIEGNSLTFGETVAFLMEGVTAKGKPLKDHLDLRGHNAAIDFLLALVKDDRGISESEIRELHRLILVEPYTVQAETATGLPTTKTILLGQYKTMPNHVRTATGAVHYYATPEETPAKMQELMTWLRAQREELHPLVLAAEFHHRFVAIHPFDDGNGRMTRLLTNLILMQAGFPPVVIKTAEKSAYYGVLSQADAGEKTPLLVFFAEHLLHALDLYLRGAQGEDIADEDDLDKEIALLKASVAAPVLARRKLDTESLAQLIETVCNDLLPLLVKKQQQLAELFFDSVMTAQFISPSRKGYRRNLSEMLPLTKELPSQFAFETATSVLTNWGKLPANDFDQKNLDLSFRFEKIKHLSPTDATSLSQLVELVLTETHVAIEFSSSALKLTHYYNEPFTKQEVNDIANAIFRPVIDGIREASADAVKPAEGNDLPI